MKNRVIEKLSVTRSELIEILVVGFLIGVCASIAGTIAYDSLKAHASWLYLGLFILLALCIWLLSKKFTRSGKARISIDGFITHIKEENSIQIVQRYGFSESMARHLNSAFSENDALKRQWDKQSLLNIHSRDKDKSSVAACKLVKEAAEYYAIEALSMHLSGYFNQKQYDKSELVEFSREDVPSILLNNRFMELFSTPMENRAIFENDFTKDKSEGVIVMSMGKNGAFYSRFDLVLPKGAKVTREDDAIVIDTSNFKLKMGVEFGGSGYVIPRDFEKYYLGVDSFKDARNFKVTFNAEVEFKMLAALQRSKWDYHAWLDGYFQKMERDMSGDQFFEKINWETVSTMIQCGQKMPNKSMQPTAEAAAD
ncbi:hypothetical protein [Teredinibacter waterburyi]|uniref:hypothetical protein n=1 Tax=Teredinibacter waterburyi TaxID=1500538 RepID=UPI00165EE38C|nr:hypothetical protein [Teredinibacter waterburyi]